MVMKVVRMVMKVERGTYWIEPVAMPNPFTIKGNNQRSLCNLRFRMFSKQGKPASIIPEIEIDDMWDPLDYSTYIDDESDIIYL